MIDAANGNGWESPGGTPRPDGDTPADAGSDAGSDSAAPAAAAAPAAPAPAAPAAPESTSWAPVSPGVPRYGEYAKPGSAPPVDPGAVDAATPPPGGQYTAPAWTPPPKPGLIPLRPLGFGTLLGAPFRYLRGARGVLGISLLLQVGLLVVIGLVGSAVFFGGFNRITDYSDPDQSPLIAGSVAASVLAGIAIAALNLVVSAFIQGVVVVDMSLAALGKRQTVRELWHRVRPSMGALVRWTLLLSVALLIAIAVLVGVVLIGVAIGGVGLVVSIGVTVLLGLGAVVLGAWLVVKFSITPSIIVLERSKALPAARRSWALTTGFFWRTLGTELLVYVIIQFAAQIISAPLSLLSIVGPLIDPTGSSGAAIGVTVGVTVLSSVVGLLIGTVGALVQAGLIALIYIDLRMRKEGLDLVLQRHIEQDGTSGASDPYAPIPRESA